jgi:endoglucanase
MKNTFSIRRGTNLGGWLSQSKLRGAERRARISRDDIRKLAGWGFDHVRLPVDEEQLWDADGRREPEAWELMNAALDWSAAAGLRVIVDLHILRSHYFNAPQRPLFTDPQAPAHFADLWRDLSAGLRNRPTDQVAYELMNEAVADQHADWNRVLMHPYRAIREGEPARLIVIGSNLWNQAYTFEFFDMELQGVVFFRLERRGGRRAARVAAESMKTPDGSAA